MTTIVQALEQGQQLQQSGQLPRAEQIYRQVLQQDPQNAHALHLLGTLALQAGKLEAAVPLLEQAVAREPNNPEFRGNLGSAYIVNRRCEEAIATLQHAIRLNETVPDNYYNLGLAFEALGRLDDAADSYRRCLERNPNALGTLNNLGTLLRELGQLDEALNHLDRAVTLSPQFGHAHYNRALVYLSQGRLEAGWPEYEWRWRCSEFNQGQLLQPRWNGAPLADQTLLISAEQGLGDTLQFIRYLPLVRQRCRNVIVAVPAPLIPILDHSGLTGLVAQGGVLPAVDVQIPMLSLPGVFATTLATIPAAVPYLQARPELIERWRHKLDGYSGFKIGIAWQGSPQYRDDRYRSIALSFFAAVAAVPGVQLFSLQKGAGVEQLGTTRDQFHVVDLGSGLDQQAGAFMDTAAAIKNLDLVITSDSAIAHLAGALGARVWVALAKGPDWRWLAQREDSPWYPTMRLFRQQQFNNWPQVFERMAGELRNLV